MQSTTQQIEQLFKAFGTALSKENRKVFEGRLLHHRTNSRNYPLHLLELMTNSDKEIQLRAAIEFKIWCQIFAEEEDYQTTKYFDIMPTVKTKSLELYLTLDDKSYKQLKESIVNICRKEYHANWQELPGQLISIAAQNFEYLIRILSLFKKITHRYSYEMRSDPLFTEIIFSCDEMHDFLLQTCEGLINSLGTLFDNNALIALKQGLKLFYNLNYQDLHPMFEENLARWMTILIATLQLQGPAENTHLFKAKGAALKSIILYSNKYKQDIYDDTIQKFSVQVYNMFQNSSKNNPNLQILMLDGLKFFRFLISWSGHKKLYADSIPDLVALLILPNIGINEDVKDEFDGDCEKFIDCFFNSADVTSKRSYAVDLMRALMKSYKEQFTKFIYAYLQSEASKELTILEQCQIYNFIIQVATTAYRSVEGATELSIDKSVIQSCYASILKPKFQQIYEWILSNPQKQIQTNFQPIQIAIQLRYIFYFRIYLPQSDLPLLLQYVSNLISNHEALRSIIYMTVEAFLTIRYGDTGLANQKELVYHFNPDNVDSLTVDILKMIYYNEKKQASLNIRLCSLLHSVTNIIKQNVVKYSQIFINIIISLLEKTETYEFKTIFQVFEAFGNFIYWMADRNEDLTGIENILQTYLTKLMGIGSDLINFILQIYSIVLSVKTNVPEIYHSIYNSLIDVANWDEKNVTLFGSYAFYITSYFRKSPQKIVDNRTGIEQIISKLIELKKHNVFFILMDEIYSQCGLQLFVETGYLRLLMLGVQAMIETSPDFKNHILKQTLMIFSKMINENNPDAVTKISNEAVQGFLAGVVVEANDVISTITWKSQKRAIIIAVSSLLLVNCFTSIDQIKVVLNAMITNSSRRNRYFLLGKLNQIPVQTSFQKLSIFKVVKSNTDVAEKFDREKENEEEYMVKCINHLIQQNGLEVIGALLTEENQKQLSSLIRKYSGEQSPVV